VIYFIKKADPGFTFSNSIKFGPA